MKFVIQRVNRASVEVDGAISGAIDKGLAVLVGIEDSDTRELADKMLAKLCRLRIFEDEAGKINLDISDVKGSLLIVSQFTLYADCRKGNRPSFVRAGKPEAAKELYDYICEEAKKYVPDVRTGIFGAYMKFSLENDGPFTVILDSDEK